MPEIPDLNIFCGNLAKRLTGKTLTAINILVPRRLKLPEAAFKDALLGQKLTAINRVGVEEPWKIGEFYGQSYFCDPRGQMLAVGSRDKDEVIIADMDFDQIAEVRATWQFYRDRRPETYGAITQP